jgi:hypothetical protein
VLDELAELWQKAVRGVVRQRDEATWARDADQLRDDAGRLRREHHAEHRGDDIEPVRRVWELLGIGFIPLHRKALGLGTCASELDHPWGDVACDDLRARARREDGEVPVAGGDVQDPRSGADAAFGSERVRGCYQALGNDRIVAERPHRLLPLLELRDEIVHQTSPSITCARRESTPCWGGRKGGSTDS